MGAPQPDSQAVGQPSTGTIAWLSWTGDLAAPLAAAFGHGLEAVEELLASLLGVCFAAPLADDFGPSPEAVVKGGAVVTGRGG